MSEVQRLRAPVVLPADPACSVVRDGVLDIGSDGRIKYCGPAAGAPEHDDLAVTECTGILLPGLINAHAHSPMTVLRGMGGELPLLRWLREVIWPAEAQLRPEDIRAGMELGSVEMLSRGVTTSVEMYFEGPQLAEAVLATGGRLVLTGAVIQTPVFDWHKLLTEINAWIDADGLRFGPGERIELGYGPHSAYTLPAEALPEIGESARARGALLTTHVAESAAEDAKQRAEYGSVPEMLAKQGFLGGRVLLAHGVHLSDSDIALLAERDVTVAHCPGSNAKLASGIARLTDLRAAGIPVGLGTDGPASNDDLDLWEEIQLSAMLARLSTSNATAVSAADALLMATREAAESLRRDDIGSLEPGRWADVVHIGVDDPAFATGLDVPDDQLLANLVWAAGSRRVGEVWVAGERVVQDGEPTRVDRRKAQAEVAAVASRLRT